MPLVALLVCVLLSQAPLPDFSGEWKMVAARNSTVKDVFARASK